MEDKIDVLNRQEFIDNVCNIVDVISKNEKGCCFAIDGAWGSGKSFVLERIEEQLKVIHLRRQIQKGILCSIIIAGNMIIMMSRLLQL